METGYTAQVARKAAKVSQRCLDYWDEKEYVSPSITAADGKGSERRYSFEDLVKLSVIKHLRDAGLSLQRIKKGLGVLQKRSLAKDPLVGLRLVTDGKRLHRLTDDPAVLEDVLGAGQLVFSVVAVGRIEKEVQERVLRIDPRPRGRRRVGSR